MTTWRKQAAVLLHPVPVRDPTRTGLVHHGFDVVTAGEIVASNQADIDACGAVLVWYAEPSVGTSMEILYAHIMDIPVHVVIAPGVHTLSPWIIMHCARVYRTLEEACEVLRGTRVTLDAMLAVARDVEAEERTAKE
jgi:hypothetical protein